MALDANTRRRWFGALALLAALGMLICGQTVLKDTLRDLTFVLYWLGCFVLTGVAVVVALLDARALQRRARDQQSDLLEFTLKEIETNAKTRPRRHERRSRRP